MKPWYKGFLPGWIVSGGGGGGLASVTTDATLKGNGTPGTPLGQVAPPFHTPFFNNNGSVTGFNIPVNQTSAQGVWLPALSVGNLTIDIGTVDAANNYDFGFYNAAGTLVAHVGAQTLPSTGYQTLPFTAGTVLFAPGLYFFAQTCVVSTARIFMFFGNGWAWAVSTTAGVTAGGVLAASITPLTKAVSGIVQLPIFALS